MKGIEIDSSRARITCKIWLMSECEYRVWGVWGVECRSQEGERQEGFISYLENST